MGPLQPSRFRVLGEDARMRGCEGESVKVQRGRKEIAKRDDAKTKVRSCKGERAILLSLLCHRNFEIS